MQRLESTENALLTGGRREQAKGERRARITAAAQDLIRELGVETMSMKQVADRAGVSLSTIYNLFESKEAVLATVYTNVFAEYREVVLARGSKDPLQIFFDAVDIAAAFYESDIAFYRSLVSLVGRDTAFKLSMQEPRFQFYSDLVSEAIDAGLLLPDADAVLLGNTIVPLYSAAFQRWAADPTGIEEFRARAKFGIVVVLSAFAAPDQTTRLNTHLARLKKRLVQARKPTAAIRTVGARARVKKR